VTETPEHERFNDEERAALDRREFAVCVATFYEDLAERLLNGAAEGFALGGVSEASVHTFRVPGAFELPFAAKLCAESGRFAGIACLGAVIRGETSHYDHVCAEVASGTQRPVRIRGDHRREHGTGSGPLGRRRA
jgi:6,7-dimethyl-8-ribityllumazine synthase